MGYQNKRHAAKLFQTESFSSTRQTVSNETFSTAYAI